MDSVTFYKRLQSSEEGRKYLALIKEGKVGDKQYEKGFERHHIQPKALGGTEESSNVVKLSVFQHVLAHVYLAKAIPCFDTIYAVQIMSGRQLKTLDLQEKILIQEAKQWAKFRELSKLCRKPQSEETKRRFVERSKKTRMEKYNGLMIQALQPDVIKQRLERVAQKYKGDSAGQMHTTSSKIARKAKMIEKYGGCTKHMQTQEVLEKARQTRIKHAGQNHKIMETTQYLNWFQLQTEEKSKYRGVSKFLKELGKTREEYLNQVQ